MRAMLPDGFPFYQFHNLLFSSINQHGERLPLLVGIEPLTRLVLYRLGKCLDYCNYLMSRTGSVAGHYVVFYSTHYSANAEDGRHYSGNEEDGRQFAFLPSVYSYYTQRLLR